MLIGYARVSKADGSQSLGLPRDALRPAGQSAYVRVEVPEPEPEPEPVPALPLLGQLLLALGLLRLGVMRLSRRGRHMMRWLGDAGIDTALIDPGKPWQNATDESFNGKLRDECLSLQWFRNRMDAKVGIEQWRRHYNEVRRP